MRITRVTIKNFRGLKHVELDLGPTTVLIGENNSGKTSVLDALRLCLRELGPRRRLVFDSLDFHLKDGTTEPQSAEPIEIEILFSGEGSGNLKRPKEKGGDFYLAQAARASRRFSRALVASTFEGQTSFTEALRLLGIKKIETLRSLGQEVGVQV